MKTFFAPCALATVLLAVSASASASTGNLKPLDMWPTADSTWTTLSDDLGQLARRGRGADDGAGHERRGRGADDGANHARRGRGADDGAGHQRRGRGADDGANHA